MATKKTSTPLSTMICGAGFLLYGLVMADPRPIGNLPLIGSFYMYCLWIWAGVFLLGVGLILQAVLLLARAKAPAAVVPATPEKRVRKRTTT